MFIIFLMNKVLTMKINPIMTAALLTAVSAHASAHTALMSSYDESIGYISCEGGFSNGASAEGVEFRIE
jgi:hypothetical protein